MSGVGFERGAPWFSLVSRDHGGLGWLLDNAPDPRIVVFSPCNNLTNHRYALIVHI